MFWSCKDSCLWHQWMRAVCRDKDRNISLLDCGLSSDFELLFVYLLSLIISLCALDFVEWLLARGVKTRIGQFLKELSV